MKITREWVDQIAPKHSRTSCNDDDLSNAYGGWTGKYNPDSGVKEVKYPRCVRCYLLLNVGDDTESLEFDIVQSVTLRWKGDKPKPEPECDMCKIGHHPSHCPAGGRCSTMGMGEVQVCQKCGKVYCMTCGKWVDVPSRNMGL